MIRAPTTSILEHYCGAFISTVQSDILMNLLILLSALATVYGGVMPLSRIFGRDIAFVREIPHRPLMSHKTKV